MSNQPLLSVIVANYNNEPYIRDCFDSIMEQDYPTLEVVVVDDCSTDNSAAIMNDYASKHPGLFNIFSNSSNRGVAFTRHRAVQEAAGEFITTLDSDDFYYDKRKLAKEMELVLEQKKTAEKEVIAFSNIALVKPDKTLIQFWDQISPIKEGHIFEDIIGRSCMIPRDFVMNKALYFAVGGYDCSLPIFEDWDLKIRLSQHYDFVYTQIPGTAYRRHGTGLSSRPQEEIIHWLNTVFEKNISLAEQTKGEITQVFEEFLAKFD